MCIDFAEITFQPSSWRIQRDLYAFAFHRSGIAAKQLCFAVNSEHAVLPGEGDFCTNQISFCS